MKVFCPVPWHILHPLVLNTRQHCHCQNLCLSKLAMCASFCGQLMRVASEPGYRTQRVPSFVTPHENAPISFLHIEPAREVHNSGNMFLNFLRLDAKDMLQEGKTHSPFGRPKKKVTSNKSELPHASISPAWEIAIPDAGHMYTLPPVMPAWNWYICQCSWFEKYKWVANNIFLDATLRNFVTSPTEGAAAAVPAKVPSVKKNFFLLLMQRERQACQRRWDNEIMIHLECITAVRRYDKPAEKE